MSENIFKFDKNSVKQQLETCETSQTQLSPLTQGNLRTAVMRKREARGELTPIKVEFNEPKSYELTDAEVQKRERRKKQNREAARKCRLNKKLNRDKGPYEKEIRQLELDNEQAELSVVSLRGEVAQLLHILTHHEMSGQCVRNRSQISHDYSVSQSAARDQQVPDQMCYSPADRTQYTFQATPLYNCNASHAPKVINTPIIEPGLVGLFRQALTSQDGQSGDELYMGNHNNTLQYSPVSVSDPGADQSRDIDGQLSQLQGDEASTNIRSLLGYEHQSLAFTSYNDSTVPKQSWPITGSDKWLGQRAEEHTSSPETLDVVQAPETEVIPSDKIGIPSLDAIQIDDLVSPRLISGFPFPYVSQRH